MRSSWLPMALPLLVILASTIFIKSGNQKVTLSAAQPTPSVSILLSVPTVTPVLATPTPTSIPIPDNKDVNDYYAKIYAKCGEVPNLPDYSSTRFRGSYSLKLWSPTCRFIAWSATIDYSFGKWSVSKYEGLFLYDLKTQKVTRVYTPQSQADVVSLKKWSTDTTFVFYKSIDSTDYIYDVPSQSVLLKYNHD